MNVEHDNGVRGRVGINTATIDTARLPVSSSRPPSLGEAFHYCEQLAESHYENFPVASFFIPKEKRPYIWSIYAFARVADDFADEGDASSEQRLEQLDYWESSLNECYEGIASHPIFVALAETVQTYRIPKKLLADLLAAFRMDVTNKGFCTFDDLLYYSKHSANPIGQLVLHLFNNTTDRTIALSDSICTALQLSNFWQDVSVDWKRGRVYIPLEDIQRFGYTERDLGARIADERFQRLMKFEVDRTKELFIAGKPLLKEAAKELHLELNLTWHGGMKILEKIEQLQYDVLHTRPALSLWDKLSILSTSLFRQT